MRKIKGKILVYAVVAILTGTTMLPIVGPAIPLLSQNEIQVKIGTLSSNGNTFYVGGSGPNNYTKIQDAINDASNGDTVFVYDDSSPYYENVVVGKSINLLGENRDTTILDGNNSGDVVYVTADWVNISGFKIKNSGGSWGDAGIDIRSNYNTISGNNISNDGDGIHLDCSDSNTITGNNISNNCFGGIWLYCSDSNTITGNNISNNVYGIVLHASGSNIITDNSFFNDGLYLLGSYQNTVSNNTVNAKPLVYLKEESDIIIDDAGQVILVKCDNITVQNQNLSNTDVGIHLFDTDNCIITGNNISSNNDDGIWLEDSNNNYICSNNISNNRWHGIYFWSSSNNTITGNNISSNNWNGIWLDYSSNNTILGNNISNNGNGIYLGYSSDNSISGNNISSNNDDGIVIYCSSNNNILGNNISKNYEGIFLYYSYFNVIRYNNFIENSKQAFFYYNQLLYSFSNCWNRNYWDSPRILPKPIFGWIVISPRPIQLIPWLNFDWRPLIKPYGD